MSWYQIDGLASNIQHIRLLLGDDRAAFILFKYRSLRGHGHPFSISVVPLSQ